MRVYQQLKNVFHWFRSHFWRVWFGFPDKGMKLYGVTGTNGKTTTCYIVDSILAVIYGREKAGMLTTVGIHIGSKELLNETKMTTLKSYAVMKYLKQMKEAGVTHVVLEVTSHALDQNRLAGLQLEGAIITNIAREHLDYHRTMEEYSVAKAKVSNYLKPGAALIVNRQFPISNFQFPNTRLIEFDANDAQSVSTPLLGEVNKENALAASLLMRAAGASEESIKKGIDTVKSVPGRMDWIEGKPRVLIDYAVTPDALERLYKDVRQQTQRKIFAILGACGMRDRGKRPDMARVVAQYADELILTREDPWTEDEEQIFADLEKGLEPSAAGPAAACSPVRRGSGSGGRGTPSSRVTRSESASDYEGTTKSMLEVEEDLMRGGAELRPVSSRRAMNKSFWGRITDRREAIKYCLERAGAEDVVVITGKGAETGMAIGKTVVPWNDKSVVLELFTELSNATSKSKIPNPKSPTPPRLRGAGKSQ